MSTIGYEPVGMRGKLTFQHVPFRSVGTRMTDWIKRRKWYAIGAATVVVLIALVAVTGRGHEVMVAEASGGPLLLRIAASGLVEADSTDLAFKGTGRIAKLYVREGDAVTEGELLARLSSANVAPGSAGVTDVVQAPYDGSVVEIYQRTGSVVSPGQPVLRMISARPPWVTAFIDSEDATHLKEGQELRCRAGGYLSAPWNLVVRDVGKEAVPRRDLPGSSRQLRVRCEVVGSSFPLSPGSEVDIDGEIPLMDSGLLIPTAAVVHEGTHDWVWLVDGSRVERRDVALGPNNFEFIHIREGVRPGDEVVVHGKEGLQDGQRVKVKPVPPAATEATGGS